MDTIVNTNETKFNTILTSTTREVNRILKYWRESNKEFYHSEIHSVFRTYLSKCIQNELGWRYWKYVIKSSYPMCITKDGKLTGISMSQFHSEAIPFIKFAETFNYLGVEDVPSETNESSTVEVESQIRNFAIPNVAVDYEALSKIKFN